MDKNATNDNSIFSPQQPIDDARKSIESSISIPVVSGLLRGKSIKRSYLLVKKKELYMRINRDGDQTIITDDWGGFGEAECIIDANGSDNNDAKFVLKIHNGGQIDDGEIKMSGGIERGYLLSFLKQVVYEMEQFQK